MKGAIETIKRCQPVIVFEAGKKSTGEYGVTPTQIHQLITDTLGYELSTMPRWLASERCRAWLTHQISDAFLPFSLNHTDHVLVFRS